MSRRSIALSLVTLLALTGCGSNAAGMLATSALPAQQTAPAAVATVQVAAQPTVTQIAGQAARPASAAQPLLVTKLTVVGSDDLSDDELADDATSLGFSIMAAGGNGTSDNKPGKPVTKTGFVRHTAAGWVLETSKGFVHKKTIDYVLTGTDDIMAKVADRANKKAQIKGTSDAKETTITVTGVKGLADMGFLMNWFSKGKIDGTVKDATSRLPIAGAAVQATSTEGYLFTDTTDATGAFALKSLQPGTYTLSISKDGYTGKTFDPPLSLKKREDKHLAIDLAAIPPATNN